MLAGKVFADADATAIINRYILPKFVGVFDCDIRHVPNVGRICNKVNPKAITSPSPRTILRARHSLTVTHSDTDTEAEPWNSHYAKTEWEVGRRRRQQAHPQR